MAGVTDSVRRATKADVAAAKLAAKRTLFEKDGDGGTTFDIQKAVENKMEALVYYGGVPVDSADYAITADTPSAGWTRFTFGFTLEGGANPVKVKIFA